MRALQFSVSLLMLLWSVIGYFLFILYQYVMLAETHVNAQAFGHSQFGSFR